MERQCNSSTEMDEAGVKRDTITYSSAISACEKGGQWELACNSYTRWTKRAKRDTITYSSAISACEKEGSGNSQCNSSTRWTQRALSATPITYNSAISACEKGGQWNSAMQLFHNMDAAGVKRDTITYKFCHRITSYFKAREGARDREASHSLTGCFTSGTKRESLTFMT